MIVEKFEKSILQDAITGKLSKHNHNDTNIDEYLAKLKKNTFIKKKGVTDKFVNKIALPENWRLVKLGNITGIYGGKRIPAGRKLTTQDTGHKYIRVADMNEITVETENIMYVPEDIYPSIKNYTISKDDLYITVAGTIGKVGFIPEELDGANLTENANKIVFGNINKKWLYYALISPFVKRQIDAFTTKVGQPKLAIKRIVNIELPIPPVEEQIRISNKIDKIFNYLSAIEPLEEKLGKIKEKFPNDMKKSILKAAIEGKLTKQNDYESSKILVEKSKNLKLNAVSNNKSKMTYCEKDKIELNFEIPSNWTKVCIGEIADMTSGGTPSRSNASYWNGEIPWLKIGDIKGKYVNESSEYITEDGLKNSSAKWFEKGTILYTIFATIGTVGILNFRATTNQAIAGITLYGDIDIEYFYYLCLGLKDVLVKEGRGGAQSNINQKILSNVEIPIPPLEEQKRIVDKLEQILPLIDEIDNMY